MSQRIFRVRRKSDGKWLRGAKYWRWTRWRRFSAKHEDQGPFEFYMLTRQPGVEYEFVEEWQ
jgi:hypothetical protein